MNRENIFRGLQIKSNEWVYGSVIFKPLKPKEENRYQLFDELGHAWIVEGNSIGQFTGLLDSNGFEIYEGDILKVGTKHGFNSDLLNEFKQLNNLDTINGIGLHFIGIVRIDLFRGLMFENIENGYQEPMFTRSIDIKVCHSNIQVIGNIYETPELLK